jgi:H+/gluconate symporter-like permease
MSALIMVTGAGGSLRVVVANSPVSDCFTVGGG